MPEKPTVEQELLAACRECAEFIDATFINGGDPFAVGDLRATRLRAAGHMARLAVERAESEVEGG